MKIINGKVKKTQPNRVFNANLVQINQKSSNAGISGRNIEGGSAGLPKNGKTWIRAMDA